MRTVIWFSCGAASAVASYLTLRENPNAVMAYCDTGGEHPDNIRFLRDVQKWLDHEIIILKNGKYQDHFDVIRQTKYVNGAGGARCTVELKKVLRFEFQRADDIQIFGYTCDEQDRAFRFLSSFPEVNAQFPLIAKNFTKEMCLGFIQESGIELPAMYKMGFNNNNCIGCVKGGADIGTIFAKHSPINLKRWQI